MGERRAGATPGPDSPRKDPASPLPGPGSPFPEALIRFVRLFNAGEYWESHEVLEGPWREGGSDFYQGLILYASAFVHLERGNRHGVLAQLAKAQARLRGYPDAYLGVDVAQVRGVMARVRQEWEARRESEGREESGERADGQGGSPPPHPPDPVPPLELAPDRIRGDEPELGAGPGRRG